MLEALEQLLVTAVGQTLPGAVAAGPLVPGHDLSTQPVLLQAESLQLDQPPPDAEEQPSRETAYSLSRHDYQAPAAPLPAVNAENMSDISNAYNSITVPGSDAIIEVQHPPGRLLEKGQDYYLDDRLIRLFQPLPPSGLVQVLLQGSQRAGYLQRLPARLELELQAHGTSAADADSRQRQCLASSLQALDPMPALADSWPSGAFVRLLKGQVQLMSWQRDHIEHDGSRYYRSRTRLRLLGTAELIVITGSPEAVGIIDHIDHRTTVSGDSPPAWSRI